MYYASTNKTEESWSRPGIQKAKPSQNSDEIMDRIIKIDTSSMSYETAVDFYKMQLATWRRFYKQSDEVEIEETPTSDGLRISKIKSLNIVFYVKETKENKIKVRATFTLEGFDEELEEL